MSLVATFGRDRAWKRKIVDMAPQGGIVLDLACGTGILSSMLASSGASVTGLDLTLEYLAISPRNPACQGTAEVMPFRDRMFDAVMSSYLAKYVDLRSVVGECRRVLKPGGVAVFHDFACPKGAMRDVWSAYFGVLRLGGIFSKSWRPVFAELDDVICRSCWIEKASESMRDAGFHDVSTSHQTLGTSAIVWGRTP